MTDRDRLIELLDGKSIDTVDDVKYVADHLIANGVTVNEWISVEDRLPEKGERVLASDGAFVGEFYLDAKSRWKRYNINDYRLDLAFDITHWMPLPDSPKEVDNG